MTSARCTTLCNPSPSLSIPRLHTHLVTARAKIAQAADSDQDMWAIIQEDDGLGYTITGTDLALSRILGVVAPTDRPSEIVFEAITVQALTALPLVDTS